MKFCDSANKQWNAAAEDSATGYQAPRNEVGWVSSAAKTATSQESGWLCLDSEPTIRKQKPYRVIEWDRIRAEGIDAASIEAVKTWLRLIRLSNLQHYFIACFLCFGFSSRLTNLGHGQSPYTELCFFIFEVVRVFEINEIERLLRRVVHGLNVWLGAALTFHDC